MKTLTEINNRMAPQWKRPLNVFIACCLAVWYVYPKFGQSTGAGIVLLLLWGLTVSVNKRGLIIGKNAVRYLCLIVWAAAVGVMIAVSTDDWFFGECKGIFLSVFCLEIYRYYFDKKDNGALKIICLVSMLAYMFTLIRSMLIGGTDYGLYRQLLHFEDVGSFATYYSAVFTVPAGIFLFGNGNFSPAVRITGIFLTVLSVLMVVIAQFTISIIMTVLLTAVIWPIMNQNTARRAVTFLIIIEALLIVCFYGLPLLSGIVIQTGGSIDNSAFGMRLTEIGYFLTGNSNGKSFDLLTRLNLYRASIVNFLQHPLIGGRFAIALGLTGHTSGHNSLMYTFEAYGLVPAACFYIYCKNTLCEVFKYWSARDAGFNKLMRAVAVAFILLSCVNPTFQLYPMTWVIMFVTFSCPLLTRKKTEESDENLSH